MPGALNALEGACPAEFRVVEAAVGETSQATIERRATELADVRIREMGDAIFAQTKDDGFKAGHEAGLAQGLKDGLEAAQNEWAALAVRAQAVIDSARAAAEREAEVSIEFALHLTFAAIRNIFGEAFASHAGLASCIERALEQTDAQTIVSIRISPIDAALFLGTASTPGLSGPLPPGVAIKADDRVGPGGCMIETTRGMLDARIETQVTALLQVLRTVYEKQAGVPLRQERPL